MKKTAKKILALGISLVAAVSSFAACGKNGNDGDSGIDVVKPVEGDSSNSKFVINCYDGGYGQNWLVQLCNELYELCKDVSFEPGKKGAYFEVVGDKSAATSLASDEIKQGSTSTDFYITSAGSPSAYMTVQNNIIDFDNVYAYDMADILSEKVFDSNGEVSLVGNRFKTLDDGQTLLDRMDDEIVDTWNFGKATGAPKGTNGEIIDKYYFMPFEDTPVGLIVDWDFVGGKMNFHGSGIDGMPGTMQELSDLFEQIRESGYAGWTMGSGTSFYLYSFENAIRSKVDGIEKTKKMAYYLDDPEGYDFGGDTGNIKISYEAKNGYWATKTKGYKAVYDFAQMMCTTKGDTTYYASDLFAKDFKQTQKDFVMSKSSSTFRRVAMLLDGEWWENETRATFNQMANKKENGYGVRDFRMMPIPRITEDDAEDKYLLSAKQTSVMVANPNTVKKGSAKEDLLRIFLQYVFSRHGLATLNTLTSISMPSYKYNLTSEEQGKLTKFGQWMYNLYRNEEFKYFRISETERFIKNPALSVRDLAIKTDTAIVACYQDARDGIQKTTDQRVQEHFEKYKASLSAK